MLKKHHFIGPQLRKWTMEDVHKTWIMSLIGKKKETERESTMKN